MAQKRVCPRGLQSALAHVLVELNAELEVVLNEIGRPDIYLPELDLFLEIKLTSYKWSKKHIVEQVAKYNEISETWIVCLDEAPEWAIETSIPWFTQMGYLIYFQILGPLTKRNSTHPCYRTMPPSGGR